MTSATWNQAMRARSANAMRTAGSTFGLGRAAGGAELGELAGGVPVQRALAGQRLGQVAEHRELANGFENGSSGPFLGTGVVGHGVDATSGSVAVGIVDRRVARRR